MKTTKKKRTYPNKTLTPAKLKFAKLVAQTDNATLAVRKAFPETAHSSVSYQTTKAHRLMTNDDIRAQIELHKHSIARLASKGLERIEQTIEEGRDEVATLNARWAYEMVHGKAIQQSTSVNMNFTQHIEQKKQAYDL